MNNLTQNLQKSLSSQATDSSPEITAIKGKMKATWADGDYDTFSRYMAKGAETVVKQWQISKDEQLLDVACGSGQTAIPSAKLGARVKAIDIADNSIQAARERASLEDVVVDFSVGDAESIPSEDNQFDVVISMFGAMFAPRPELVVKEFSRVCKPGGRIHMANWTPDCMVGQMFKIIGRHIAPPGIQPPALWGHEETVMERLSGHFTNIKLVRKNYPEWKYPFDASELVNFFRAYYGPIKRAFEALDQQGQVRLHQELAQNFQSYNMASDGSLDLKGEYLDITAYLK